MQWKAAEKSILQSDLGKNKAIIEISDTGKGIARKNQKAIFNPGFTTKSRGWGLGLTLTKRIIEEYHGGLIYVKNRKSVSARHLPSNFRWPKTVL